MRINPRELGLIVGILDTLGITNLIHFKKFYNVDIHIYVSIDLDGHINVKVYVHFDVHKDVTFTLTLMFTLMFILMFTLRFILTLRSH